MSYNPFSGLVKSVFGRTGAVVAAGGDYNVSQVTGAAPLASPAFTGTPTAPTAVAGTNTTQLATTAFVDAALSVLSVTVALTNAQIIALPTTPFTLVAAPGAGKYIVPLGGSVSFDTTAGNYTNINASARLFLSYGTLGITLMPPANQSNGQLTTLLASTGKAVGVFGGTIGITAGTLQMFTNTDANVDNQALTLNLSNVASGNLTGGNAANSGKVTVFYQVVSV